jgi:hypothetical protein
LPENAKKSLDARTAGDMASPHEKVRTYIQEVYKLATEANAHEVEGTFETTEENIHEEKLGARRVLSARKKGVGPNPGRKSHSSGSRAKSSVEKRRALLDC